MRNCFKLALLATLAIAGQALAGERYTGTWWNGVTYDKGQFKPDTPDKGRPALVNHSTWKSEKLPDGTVIHVGKDYLTADEQGVVQLAPKLAPGSYWGMKEVESKNGQYNAKDDWKGSWHRTTYTLEPTAPGLKGGKLGFRDGKLTLHPKNEGLAILAVTNIDATEVSGK
jgi:hypothetical protein